MTREIALHCMKSYSESHSDLCELCPIYGQTGSDHCFEDALEYVIKDLEQEPRKGHWIIDTHKIRAFGEKNETHDYSVHCDKCNYAWDYTTDKEGSLVSNYCPNCGADMREVKD
ncbi:MAG: hypothetical protein J6M44_15490 [Butyrivibrio sp.]|nr:hypothetical protein [Butyrivibrio sp.]